MTETRIVVRRKPSRFQRSQVYPDTWIMVGEPNFINWSDGQLDSTFIDVEQYEREHRDEVLRELREEFTKLYGGEDEPALYPSDVIWFFDSRLARSEGDA